MAKQKNKPVFVKMLVYFNFIKNTMVKNIIRNNLIPSFSCKKRMIMIR
ncbi:MAG: hypothetical protein ACLUG5_01810 [Clostridia bacterium]